MGRIVGFTVGVAQSGEPPLESVERSDVAFPPRWKASFRQYVSGRMFGPDMYTSAFQYFAVGLPAQEPQQFLENGLEREAAAVEQWQPITSKIKFEQLAEQGASSRARAVVPLFASFQYFSYELLVHAVVPCVVELRVGQTESVDSIGFSIVVVSVVGSNIGKVFHLVHVDVVRLVVLQSRCGGDHREESCLFGCVDGCVAHNVAVDVSDKIVDARYAGTLIGVFSFTWFCAHLTNVFEGLVDRLYASLDSTEFVVPLVPLVIQRVVRCSVVFVAWSVG